MRPFFPAVFVLVAVFVYGISISTAASPRETLGKLAAQPGIVCVLDLPDGDAQQLVAVAKSGAATLYFQSSDAKQVAATRQAAEQAGLLGTQVFVGTGPHRSIHLADNVADGVVVAASAAEQVSDAELLRALRPKATAFVGDRKIVKPVPDGIECMLPS